MNYSFIKVKDFLPNLLQEVSQGNLQNNFSDYLLHLIFHVTCDNDAKFKSKSTSWPSEEGKFSSREYFLKRIVTKFGTEVKSFITIDQLIPYFLEECAEKFLPIDRYFARYILHLFMRDIDHGLDTNASKLSVCKLEEFLQTCLEKYANILDPTVCNMKMCYYYKKCPELELVYSKQKYSVDSTDKLSNLIKGITQYPETSSPKQLEEMFLKMQIFIITNYSIGCPKNVELMKQTRRSLESVLGKGDLQKYVLKKKYHRLEYLERLGATVCGILTFNNYNCHQTQSKDNTRNIFLDLQMALCNTKDSLHEGLKRASVCIQKGVQTVANAININVTEHTVKYLLPARKTREINKFVILFLVYERCLRHIIEVFEKTQHLIDLNQKKFNCVMEKINDILKFRSAIETELIFPHFVYLSEVWTSLVLYLKHLVEINKIKDHLDELLSENMENKFHSLLDEMSEANSGFCVTTCFDESMILNNEMEKNHNFNTPNILKDYCSLTMALTKGLLVPARLERKLSNNLNITFGFANPELAKYSEKNFATFFKAFKNAIFTSVDLILLLQLDDQMLQQDFDLVKQAVSENKDSFSQTDFSLESNVSPSGGITWNIWDYHRHTIHLANLKRQQTTSTQTKVSSGKMNAQSQCATMQARGELDAHN